MLFVEMAQSMPDASFTYPFSTVAIESYIKVRRSIHVVARTSGAQFLARLAGDFSESRLDIHMHIFECCAPRKAIVRDLL